MSSIIQTTFISKNDILLNMLTQFYKNDYYMNTMLEIITGKSNISLRIIDWFVTNYAKKNDTYYELKNGIRFRVYHSYKSQLKSYGKTSFDPFCRSMRICLPYKDDKGIETTIGQLNFFKWILENEMLEYIITHHDIIEDDMKNRGSMSKRKDIGDVGCDNSTSTKTRKKRRELSVSAIKSIKREDVEITLKFS
jgi:hypothetical protein